MTRGLQKLQAQAKNNEKKAAAGKKSDGKAAAAAAIKYNCQFCKTMRTTNIEAAGRRLTIAVELRRRRTTPELHALGFLRGHIVHDVDLTLVDKKMQFSLRVAAEGVEQRAPMSDLQTYREHFDAKHPKLAHPPEFATA
ncbi:hypothetical protein CAOG_00510 [Capsaspora owczarzaki ATCC 30864]|uniref:hypothetical protein n=1 Tax=Capsaspora owczarzaki (strain ATCC 30864) TaxID=595528 RepID=UPI0001FE2551|nr:hypothetical protein CAOG_00510 [Capsaspora owczarzaki ATCC 30864]|eukprot:XP_004365381.1 hypothetical protein CAOG_00510 [Capsaspora owczarzaki ATCC 30864]